MKQSDTNGFKEFNLQIIVSGFSSEFIHSLVWAIKESNNMIEYKTNCVSFAEPHKGI